MTFEIGDTVALADSVIQRLGYTKSSINARGHVTSIGRALIAVDFMDTWIKHENGGSVRYFPANNLKKVN